jgi:hypothetical protein
VALEPVPDPPARLSAPAQPRFTCPVCGRSSSCRQDWTEGYCGACRAFTGEPQRTGLLALLVFEHGAVRLLPDNDLVTERGVITDHPGPGATREEPGDDAMWWSPGGMPV